MAETNEPLHLLSIGAGAIGTYIGGSLALGGHEVVFVERPEVAEELRSRGLRLDLSGAERHLPNPRIADSIEQALAMQEFDVALFALKSFDTPGFLASLTVTPEAMPPILCLSNGVDNEPTIAAALGPDKVIAGTVTSAIGRRGSGGIALEKLRGIGVALPEQAGDTEAKPLCERLVASMDAAALNPRLFASATSAILDMPPGEIFAHPGLYRLEIAQLRERFTALIEEMLGDAIQDH